MTAAPWSALPFPTRGSAFYSLKSIAFSKDAVAGGKPQANGGRGAQANVSVRSTVEANGGKGGGVVLPPVGQNSSDLDGNRPDDKATASRQQLRRRDAALDECRKVQEQLREVFQKLGSVRQEMVTSHKRKQELAGSTVKCKQNLKEEVERIKRQQLQLRTLRQQVKELKEPCSIQPGAPSEAVLAGQAGDAMQALGSLEAKTSPGSGVAVAVVPGEAVAASPAFAHGEAVSGAAAKVRAAHLPAQQVRAPQLPTEQAARRDSLPFFLRPSTGTWLRPRPILLWDPAKDTKSRNASPSVPSSTPLLNSNEMAPEAAHLVPSASTADLKDAAISEVNHNEPTN